MGSPYILLGQRERKINLLSVEKVLYRRSNLLFELLRHIEVVVVQLVNTGTTTLSLMVDADPDTGSKIMLVPNAIFNETISGKTVKVKSDTVGGKLGYVLLA